MYFEDEERRKKNLNRALAWSRENRNHPRVLKYTPPVSKPIECEIAYIAGLTDHKVWANDMLKWGMTLTKDVQLI